MFAGKSEKLVKTLSFVVEVHITEAMQVFVCHRLMMNLYLSTLLKAVFHDFRTMLEGDNPSNPRDAHKFVDTTYPKVSTQNGNDDVSNVRRR